MNFWGLCTHSLDNGFALYIPVIAIEHSFFCRWGSAITPRCATYTRGRFNSTIILFYKLRAMLSMVLFGDGTAGLFDLVRRGTILSESSAIRISKHARLDTGLTLPYFESVLPSSS